MTDTGSAILHLPEPLVSVTPAGIFVEWHAHGINVEVRLRKDYTWVIVEDTQGQFENCQGSDDGAIQRALDALAVMESRGDAP